MSAGSEGTATLESPAARLRGVRKRFGYQDVLRGVDLEVPRGGIFVIFGPNGAGKSTILRLLATQWSSTAGTVEVLGHDVRREPILIRSQLGLVFHEPFLRRELTVEENLRFASELHGIDGAAAPERIERLLGRFGILHRRRDAVGTLSQGMTKRASLARSLLNEPRLWILDEPFSG
ncbi:MAG TPA: ABC transporter ATP-binding protein, partial [Planctomycetota bacterium]|nr:ABC transporter ATP-binding protein [Planctomycetota bacterium]